MEPSVRLTRRTILRIGSLALAAPAAGILQALPGGAQTAPAPSRNWRHGLSLFGDLHYPDGFPRFDYVNPDAPRGGTVRLSALGTFDNFNVAVASVKGQLAAGLGLIYNRMLASAQDEVTTMYGLLAEAVDYPPDHSWVAYRLRPEARWHDGTPVTAEDVIFSFESWKKLDPELSAYYRHVVKAERIGEREVSFTFDSAGNRELPLIVGELSVAQALVAGERQERQQARYFRHQPRAAAGRGPVPDQGFRTGALGRLRTGQGLLGRPPQRQRRAEQFRGDPLRVFPGLHGRARSLQGRSDRLAHREQRQELGHGLRFSRGARQAGRHRRISDAQPRGDAGIRLQHPARQVQGSAPAPRVQFRVRFRGDEQADLLWPVPQDLQLFRRHRARFVGHPGGPGAGDSRDRPPQDSAGAVRDAVHQPGRGQRGSGAGQPARSAETAEGSRLRDSRPQAGECRDRRAAEPGDPGRRSELRTHRAVLPALA